MQRLSDVSQKKFVIVGELEPRNIRAGRLLRDAGYDAISITALPERNKNKGMSNSDISPNQRSVIAAVQEAREQIISIATITGRNFSPTDLEIAQENGVRNIIALKGDMPKGTEPNFKYGTASLIHIIRKDYPDLAIGAVLRTQPGAEGLKLGINMARPKIQAGADFLVTDTIVNPDYKQRIKTTLKESHIDIPVFGDVGILENTRNLENLEKRNIIISSGSAKKRLEQGQSGVELAVEVAKKISSEVDGIWISPLLRRTTKPAKLLLEFYDRFSRIAVPQIA